MYYTVAISNFTCEIITKLIISIGTKLLYTRVKDLITLTVFVFCALKEEAQ